MFFLPILALAVIATGIAVSLPRGSAAKNYHCPHCNGRDTVAAAAGLQLCCTCERTFEIQQSVVPAQTARFKKSRHA